MLKMPTRGPSGFVNTFLGFECPLTWYYVIVGLWFFFFFSSPAGVNFLCCC